MELGYMFDHFEGQALDMQLYRAPGMKDASGAPLRTPEKHGKLCDDVDVLNPKNWFYLEVVEGQLTPDGRVDKEASWPRDCAAPAQAVGEATSITIFF